MEGFPECLNFLGGNPTGMTADEKNTHFMPPEF